MIRKEKVTYFILNETSVDEDIYMKNRKILHENVFGDGVNKLFTLTFKQVLQSFGNRNWNGRIYTENVVMNALNNNPLVQNDIKNDTWCGEFGHPIIEKGVNELARQMTIFPPNACWRIHKYYTEGNLLIGECTTLAGGYGDILRDRILTGLPSMASSRAIGGVDARGNVLPGYQIITFDSVIRPSHKEAYQVSGSNQLNAFPIKTDLQNTMTESAIPVDIINDKSFADFILSESATKQQISMLCDTFKLDYDSMTINESAIKFTSMNNDEKTTVTIPLRQFVNAEYYNLF